MKEGQLALKLGQKRFLRIQEWIDWEQDRSRDINTQHYIFSGICPANLSSFQPYLSDYNVLSAKGIYIMDVTG